LAAALAAASAAAFDRAANALAAIFAASALDLAVRAACFASIVLKRALAAAPSCSTLVIFPWSLAPLPFLRVLKSAVSAPSNGFSGRLRFFFPLASNAVKWSAKTLAKNGDRCTATHSISLFLSTPCPLEERWFGGTKSDPSTTWGFDGVDHRLPSRGTGQTRAQENGFLASHLPRRTPAARRKISSISPYVISLMLSSPLEKSTAARASSERVLVPIAPPVMALTADLDSISCSGYDVGADEAASPLLSQPPWSPSPFLLASSLLPISCLSSPSLASAAEAPPPPASGLLPLRPAAAEAACAARRQPCVPPRNAHQSSHCSSLSEGLVASVSTAQLILWP